MKLSPEERNDALLLVYMWCNGYKQDLLNHSGIYEISDDIRNKLINNHLDKYDVSSPQSIEALVINFNLYLKRLQEKDRDMKCLLRAGDIIWKSFKKPRQKIKTDIKLAAFFRLRASFAEKWIKFEVENQSIFALINDDDF